MRIVRDPAVRFVVVATTLVAAVTAGALAAGADSPDVSAPTTTTVPPPPAELSCPDAGGDVDSLRSCLSGVLVFVETPVGTGSGVVLESGEVVTNAHVVGPFDRVDLTFVGGRSLDDVEVVGVSAQDDIAVLGPLTDAGPGVSLARLPEPGEATPDDVFLMGYPLGAEGDSPQVTITQGVLSRTRSVPDFDQLFLQTDAVIAGGQSGGALFDGQGRLLGISGYSYDQFSLSLSADDVIEAVELVHAGGDDRVVMPRQLDDWEATTEVRFPARDSTRRLLVPGSPDARTVTLNVDTTASYSVDVLDLFGMPLATYWDGAGEDDFGFDDPGAGGADWFESLDDPSWYGELIEPDDDGNLTFEIAADTPAAIDIWMAPKAKIDITLDVPYVVAAGVVEGDPIEVGETARGLVDAVNGRASHSIELERGDELAITAAGSPLIPSVTLLSPDDSPLQTYAGYGYGGVGLSMVDTPVTQRYRITKSGTFTIVVESPVIGAYELTIDSIS